MRFEPCCGRRAVAIKKDDIATRPRFGRRLQALVTIRPSVESCHIRWVDKDARKRRCDRIRPNDDYASGPGKHIRWEARKRSRLSWPVAYNDDSDHPLKYQWTPSHDSVNFRRSPSDPKFPTVTVRPVDE